MSYQNQFRHTSSSQSVEALASALDSLGKNLEREFQAIQKGITTGDTTVNVSGGSGGGGGSGVSPHNLLSSTHTDTLVNSPILGDILFGNYYPQWTRLAGNITATRMFLRQVGTAAVSADPAWDTILDADLPATIVRTSRSITIAGTTNRITSSAGAQDLSANRTWTLDISASYVGQSSITTLGTITTGVWTGTTIAIANGGTGQVTAVLGFNALSPITTKGDIITRDGTDNIRLGVGTDTFVLTADSTTASGIKWAAGGGASPLTTKGDIYVFSTVNDRLPVGTDGFVLSADSTTGTGLKWIAATGTGTVTSVSWTGGIVSIATPTSTPAFTIAGTSGGIVYFSSTTTWASSALLAANQLVLGGGAGTAPATLGSIGTTTTLLHGNAAGAPSFSAVVLTTDVSGLLPIGNGGTGQATALPAFNALSPLTTRGDLLTRDATDNARVAIGTAGKYIRSDGTDPSWQSITAADITAGTALTKVDDTNVTLTLGGAPTTALLSATSLTLNWTGTLAPTRGGTGTGTYTLGDTLYSDAVNSLAKLAGNITTTKKFLRQTGSGAVSAAPVWDTVLAADVASGAALTKVDDTNITLTLGGAPTTALLVAASLTLGWTGTLSVTRGGTGANLSATGGTSQYVKQVSVGAAFTVGAIAAADLPSSFSGLANPSASVGLSAVNGSATTAMRSDGAPALSQAIAPTWTAPHFFAPAVRTSGVAHYFSIVTPADTTLTTLTESIGIQFGGTNALTPLTVTRQWATGNITTQREYVFTAPTYAFVGPSTITTAATVAITSEPLVGANATLTNSYALWVQSGGVRFGSNLTVVGNLNVVGSVSFDYNQGIKFANLTHAVLYNDGTPFVQGVAHVADGSILSSKGTTTAPAYRTLLGTTNQITVTTAAGSFTLSTPQNIHTAATPQFTRIGIGVAADATALGLFQNNQNGVTQVTIKNTTAGAAAETRLAISSDAGSDCRLSVFSSSVGAIGILAPNSFFMYSDNAAGLAFSAGHASGPIKFASGGTAVKLTLNSSGNLDAVGKITTYLNVATTNNGVGFLVASSNLVTRAAAIGATTIYAVPAAGAGLYKVSWMATVTGLATTSCVLGGTTAFALVFTDQNDSVVKTANPSAVTNHISAVNATGTTVSGVLCAYCKASTNLQYTFGYTSVGATAMQYDLSIRVEFIG